MRLLTLSALSLLLVLTSACAPRDDRGPAEEVGMEIDRGGERLAENFGETLESAGDRIENFGEDVWDVDEEERRRQQRARADY